VEGIESKKYVKLAFTCITGEKLYKTAACDLDFLVGAGIALSRLGTLHINISFSCVFLRRISHTIPLGALEI
jgi:hypothetical protein